MQARIDEWEKMFEEERRAKERPPTEVQPPVGQPPAGETAAPETAPIPEPPRAGEMAEPWYRDRVGWILVGSGVVPAGLGGGFMLHASSLRDDAVAELDEDEANELNDRAGTYRVLGASMLVVGAAVTTVGIVKLIRHDSPASTTASAGTNVTIGVGWVGLEGRF